MNSISVYEKILQRAAEGVPPDRSESVLLLKEAPLSLLVAIADSIRREKHPATEVTWIIDRNVNITNVCVSQCRFCNFCCKPNSPDAYITGMDEYIEKINDMMQMGGNQLLIQGGLHPDLGIEYYETLFRELKSAFPSLKLHALGPPEVVYLAGKEKLDYGMVLRRLVSAGLDSLPGAGAEILVDRVRKIVSPAKCSAEEWLEVMRVAHAMGLVTSATMMFGHAETPEERIEHLFRIREVQSQRPKDTPGFLNFVPWPFQDKNTMLNRKYGIRNTITASEYVRFIAISRIVLHNVDNIQASWLTVGKATAQLCLHAGANDFGSVMIEEKVVSGAGADHSFSIEGIQMAIKEAGFIPRRRTQAFEKLQA